MAGKALTPRQAQVAALCAQGLSTAQAASCLGIARTTADTYLQGAYARTGTRDRDGLLNWLTASSPGKGQDHGH